MKLPIIDYIYVDEFIIADNVIYNYDEPFTEEDILAQIDAYIDSEEESSLIHHLTDDQIEQIRDTVVWLLLNKDYEVVYK